MNITSFKIKKVVSILLDIKEDEIFNMYTVELGEYVITFKTSRKDFLLCCKEGDFKTLI